MMDVAVDKFIKGRFTASDRQTESVKELVSIVVWRAVHVSCSVDKHPVWQLVTFPPLILNKHS